MLCDEAGRGADGGGSGGESQRRRLPQPGEDEGPGGNPAGPPRPRSLAVARGTWGAPPARRRAALWRRPKRARPRRPARDPSSPRAWGAWLPSWCALSVSGAAEIARGGRPPCPPSLAQHFPGRRRPSTPAAGVCLMLPVGSSWGRTATPASRDEVAGVGHRSRAAWQTSRTLVRCCFSNGPFACISAFAGTGGPWVLASTPRLSLSTRFF